RLAHGVARTERVGELLTVRVEQHGTVRARRLRNRVALHLLWPRTSARVVLQRVKVAHLCAEVDGDLRHLAGGTRMVRRKLTSLFRDAETPPARCEAHGRGDDRVAPATRAPAVLGPGEV